MDWNPNSFKFTVKHKAIALAEVKDEELQMIADAEENLCYSE